MTLVEVLALTQRVRTCRDEWLTGHFPLRDSASPREPPLISHRHPESALDLDLFLDDDKRRCMLRLPMEVLMNKAERITIDPEICHGKPCIRGLRYTVEMILELLSSGMTVDEVLADYEDLEREDILAVLAFAARLSQVKRINTIAA